MQRLLAVCLLLCSPVLASATALEELKLLNEQAVSGVTGGNLSGLAWCDNALWAVSDRDDQQLYRLESDESQWQPNWLKLPQGLLRQARASGMALHYNSLFEGIAVDPAGDRLYLAAERMRRGLLVAHKQRAIWRCTGGCVLFSEAGTETGPEQLGGKPQPRDFSGLAFHNEKLFTLERQAHRICRRDLNNGQVEKCWSFAAEALTPERLYAPSYGLAEALWVDQDGAWIGVDNGSFSRADGESRPIIWRFAAPKGGWGSKP